MTIELSVYGALFALVVPAALLAWGAVAHGIASAMGGSFASFRGVFGTFAILAVLVLLLAFAGAIVGGLSGLQ